MPGKLAESSRYWANLHCVSILPLGLPGELWDQLRQANFIWHALCTSQLSSFLLKQIFSLVLLLLLLLCHSPYKHILFVLISMVSMGISEWNVTSLSDLTLLKALIYMYKYLISTFEMQMQQMTITNSYWFGMNVLAWVLWTMPRKASDGSLDPRLRVKQSYQIKKIVYDTYIPVLK